MERLRLQERIKLLDRTKVSLELCYEGMTMCSTVEEKVAARLSSFLELSDNWDGENEGRPFDVEELNWANAFIKILLGDQIVKPHIFPEVPSDVRLEWSDARRDVMVTLVLKTHHARLFAIGKQSKQVQRDDLNLDSMEDSIKLRKILCD